MNNSIPSASSVIRCIIEQPTDENFTIGYIFGKLREKRYGSIHDHYLYTSIQSVVEGLYENDLLGMRSTENDSDSPTYSVIYWLTARQKLALCRLYDVS